MSLRQPDLRTRQARAAAQYMEHKGYDGIRPLGFIPVDEECSYFYYKLPEGILELEVCASPDGFGRRVTAFVTDPKDVRELLPL